MIFIFWACLLVNEHDLSFAVSMSFDSAVEEIGIDNKQFYFHINPLWENDIDIKLASKVFEPSFHGINIFEYLIPSPKNSLCLNGINKKHEMYDPKKIKARGCTKKQILRSGIVGIHATDEIMWIVFSFEKTWLNEKCIEFFRPEGTADYFIFIEFNMKNKSITRLRVFEGF